MSKKGLSLADVTRIFGVDPRTVGVNHLGWFIVKEIGQNENCVGAKKGYLCVQSQDKTLNHWDTSVSARSNFIGNTNDLFDHENLNYYFRPLENGV